MSDIIWIIIIIAIAAGAIIATLIITSKKEYNPLEEDKTRSQVIVTNGVDMDSFVYGAPEDSVFPVDERGTLTADGKENIYCHASFYNQGTGKIIQMQFYPQLIIGRQRSNDPQRPILTIRNDQLVSKYHCALTVHGNSLVLTDLNSHNHTYLNGRMVVKAADIRDGDEITVGYTKLRIHYQIR